LPQVSHHIHCNDDALDEDVFSAFPFLRFDPRLPRAWYHQYQHIYMWLTFPLLQAVFQVGGRLELVLAGGVAGWPGVGQEAVFAVCLLQSKGPRATHGRHGVHVHQVCLQLAIPCALCIVSSASLLQPAPGGSPVVMRMLRQHNQDRRIQHAPCQLPAAARSAT
jgi:hypothetical protein